LNAMRRITIRAVLMVIAALALVLTATYRVVEAPFWGVPGSRLMPSFAMEHGVNYYVPAHGGPLYSNLYGPLTALVYLPATLWPAPNGAVLAGAAMTALLCLGGAAFLHFVPWRERRGRADALAFLAAGLLMCYLEPLKYSCFSIHADGPGLACGAAACGALYFLKYGARWATPVSACFAVLAVFAKETFLPLAVALLVWVLASAGAKSAVRYGLWLAAAGGAAGAATIYAFGFDNLYHCLIWVPGHQPWNEASRLASAYQSLRSFERLSLLVVIVLLACGFYAAGEISRGRLRALVGSRCAPLLLAGIAMLPSAMAGRAKVGGDINSFSLALFFLTCGMTVMLADIARAGEPAVARGAFCLLAAIVTGLVISEGPLALGLPRKVRELPAAGQNVAFEYLRRHPAEAYFPWFPLAHWYADHQFCHYGFGIGDRLSAGEPFTEPDMRAYMPPHPKEIAFARDGTTEVYGFNLMRLLPEYPCLVKDAELPGWQVYRMAVPGQPCVEGVADGTAVRP
jgi:hypothetical protein